MVSLRGVRSTLWLNVVRSLTGPMGRLPIRRGAGCWELLRLESMRVTELAAPFDVSLEAASKHIRVLEAAGLVSRSIRGRDHVLSLDAEPLLPAAEWIQSYRSFWEERLRALEAYLKERP